MIRARGATSTLLILAAIGLVAAAGLALLDQATRERIALEEERRALATLEQVLDPGAYDNALIRDRYRTRIPGLDGPATLYRARAGDEPVALVADVVTARGYSGDIRLLVAVDPGGEVLAVRVLAHRETPGLGDRIEIERSGWIRQFAGRSLGDPERAAWRADRKNGAFDTLSAATITSQAVIEAVRAVLDWFEEDPETPFQTPSEAP